MGLLSFFYHKKWVFSIVAGILLAISLSPFPFPFPLLSIAGFFFLLRLADITRSASEMAYVAFPGLIIWNTLTTYWLVIASIPGGIAAIAANSVIMTFPLMLIWKIRRLPLPFWVQALSIPAIWVTYEFLHFRWDLSWPWLCLGNHFSTAPWLVQYISVTGILGISFWIVLSSWLLCHYFSSPLSARKMPSWLLMGILFLPPTGSLLTYLFYDPEPVDTIEVAIMQPNYNSIETLAGYPNPIDPLIELLEYSDGIVTPETKAVFWPENSIMVTVRDGFPGEAEWLMHSFARRWNAPLIAGSSLLYRYPPDKEPLVTRGNYVEKNYNIYNSALGFYPDGSFFAYKKNKLVPMVERFPFIHTFKRMDRFGWVDWSNQAMFGKGKDIRMFDIDGRKAPAFICYDSVYPDWVRRFVKNNAAFVAIITNDGWWGNTSGHIQHFDFARLRAVETRRTVIRSANNGLSGVILSNGDVAKQTTYWTRDRFTHRLPVHEGTTFYVRHGDLIGWISLFITLMAATGLFFIKTVPLETDAREKRKDRSRLEPDREIPLKKKKRRRKK